MLKDLVRRTLCAGSHFGFLSSVSKREMKSWVCLSNVPRRFPSSQPDRGQKQNKKEETGAEKMKPVQTAAGTHPAECVAVFSEGAGGKKLKAK